MNERYRESEVDKKLRAWFVNDMSRSLLRAIELQKGHLRGLSRCKISLDYPITAIAGRNGSGKSTVLAMASCAYHNSKDGFKLKNRNKTYYTFSDFFIQYADEIPPQGIDIYFQIAHDHWKPSKNVPDGVGIGYQRRWKREGGKWNDYAGRVNSDVVFLGIHRVLPHSERSQSKSYSKKFKDVGNKGWEKDVKDAVGFILGKEYQELKYLEHSKYILPVVKSNGVVYSGLNMGAGENALFEIFRIIYSCTTGTLLVIDEIELGLHMDAQSKLMRRLKEVCLARHIQVLCTTHSANVFRQLPPDARKYIECYNKATVVTDGISEKFAMAKLGAAEQKELDVILEDGVALDIASLALPAQVRQRVKFAVIGSASALSRQLAAAYVRNPSANILAIFDGDQHGLESKNMEYARSMVENCSKVFNGWFVNHVCYLPGAVWTEAWLVQENQKHLGELAQHLGVDENHLADVLSYGLQAGKHSEFHELALQLNLTETQCVQYLVDNLRERDPGQFAGLVSAVQNALG